MKICSYAALISFILIAVFVILAIAIWKPQEAYVEKNTFSLNKNEELRKYYYKYFGYKGNFFIPVMGEDNYYILDIGEIVKENGLDGRILFSSPYGKDTIFFLSEDNNGNETSAYMINMDTHEIKAAFSRKLEEFSGYRISEGILYQHTRTSNNGVKVLSYDIESGKKIFENNGILTDCKRRNNYWYYKESNLLFVNCGPVDAAAKKNPEKDETFGIVNLSTGNKIFEQSGNIIWNNSFIDPENVLYTYEGVLYTYNALKNEGHEIKLDVSEGARMRKDTLIDRIHFLDNQIILVRYTRKKDWFSYLLYGYGYDYKYYYYLGEYESSDTIVIKEQLKGKPFIKDWLITDIEAME